MENPGLVIAVALWIILIIAGIILFVGLVIYIRDSIQKNKSILPSQTNITRPSKITGFLSAQQSAPKPTTKQCPFCKSDIPTDASHCRFCGKDVSLLTNIAKPIGNCGCILGIIGFSILAFYFLIAIFYGGF